MAKTKKETKENIKGMSGEDLNKKLAVLREHVRTIHFKEQGSKSKNVKEAASLRKQIARVLTEVNSR